MTNKTSDQLPNNHVFGVLTGRASAAEVEQLLKREGFDEVAEFRGEELADAVDPHGEKSGIIGSIVKGIQDHLSEEQNYLQQYVEEARRGREVVAVGVHSDDQVGAARNLLQQHGAENIRFFGRLAVHDLTPESNPSTRSAESPEKWSEV